MNATPTPYRPALDFGEAWDESEPEGILFQDRRRVRGLPCPGTDWRGMDLIPPDDEVVVPGKDDLTVVTARGGRNIAKAICAGEVIRGYDKASRFNLAACHVGGLDENRWPVGGVDDLVPILRNLLRAPWCAVARGSIADPARTQDVRRLLHDDPATGDKATLIDVPRFWIALDMDDVPLPGGVDARDLAACGRAAIATLPAEFHDARCIVQATASHGIKPGCRLRLWFWGSRPTWNRELKVWLKHAPVDRSIFHPSQLIYTSAPAFVDCSDHLPERLTVLPGRDVVQVPRVGELQPPAPPPPPPLPRFASDADRLAYARAALQAAAAEVAGAGEGERHTTLTSRAARLARYVHAGIVSEQAARMVLTRAAEAAGLEEPDKIAKAITWGLSRPDHNPFGGCDHA